MLFFLMGANSTRLPVDEAAACRKALVDGHDSEEATRSCGHPVRQSSTGPVQLDETRRTMRLNGSSPGDVGYTGRQAVEL